MIRDQERNHLAVGLLEPQALQAFLRIFKAGDQMIVTRQAFPYIMEQKGQVKQFGTLQFLEEMAVALVPLRSRTTRAVQALDCEKRMLVHGEPVIKITHYERIDQLQFREEHREQAERMHGAERLGGMRLNQDRAQISPAFRPGRRRFYERRQNLLNSRLSRKRRLQAVMCGECKNAKQEITVPNC